jgi:hypothetical protein
MTNHLVRDTFGSRCPILAEAQGLLKFCPREKSVIGMILSRRNREVRGLGAFADRSERLSIPRTAGASGEMESQLVGNNSRSGNDVARLGAIADDRGRLPVVLAGYFTHYAINRR